jgi:carbonic anhydrase
MDEQKLILNVCSEESEQIKKLNSIIEENQRIVRSLNKTMVREISTYKNVN